MQAAVEKLSSEIDALKVVVTEQQEGLLRRDHEISNLKHEIEHYREQLKLSKHRAFAPSSEKHMHEGQGQFFNEAEDNASQMPPPPKGKKEKSHKSKPKRSAIDPNLPRQEQKHDFDPADKTCCGKEMSLLGQTVTEQVDMIPAKMVVKKHIRYKYVCRCCNKIKTSSMPKQPIPKSLAAPGLLASIAINKYADGLPLYRQEGILGRAGLTLPRNTTSGWMIALGNLYQPLFNLMQEDQLEQPVLQADETTIRVLKENGKKIKKKNYVWVTATGKHNTGPPIILFHYGPSRSGEVAKRLLSDWGGYLMTDGYEGYSKVITAEGITDCACVDHVRRKFKDAINAREDGTPSGLAEDALWYLYQLYGVEEREIDASESRRKLARNLYSRSILDHFRKWLDRNIGGVRPSSPTGIALNYLNNQWSKLVRVLESGLVPISNERCENAIRPFVIGRKGWLFSATSNGADASCVIYSMIETAKANGIEPYYYLRYINEKLPLCETAEDYAKLLPYNLTAEQLENV